MEFLKTKERVNKTGHYARQIRRQGRVPGILYGNTMGNFMFEVGELELNREILSNGSHGIMNLDINGKIHKTLIKEIQKDAVTNKIIHLDLEEIVENQKVETEVPVVFSNEEYILRRGGVIQKEKDSLKIKCTPDKLPRFITANLNPDQIGTVIRIQDVELGEEITFLENPETVIASISYVSTKDEINENDLEK